MIPVAFLLVLLSGPAPQSVGPCDVSILEGRVLDSAGRPIRSAQVQVLDGGRMLETATTDRDGRFTVCGLPTRRSLTMSTGYDGYYSTGETVRLVDGARRQVDLRLASEASGRDGWIQPRSREVVASNRRSAPTVRLEDLSGSSWGVDEASDLAWRSGAVETPSSCGYEVADIRRESIGAKGYRWFGDCVEFTGLRESWQEIDGTSDPLWQPSLSTVLDRSPSVSAPRPVQSDDVEAYRPARWSAPQRPVDARFTPSATGARPGGRTAEPRYVVSPRPTVTPSRSSPNVSYPSYEAPRVAQRADQMVSRPTRDADAWVESREPEWEEDLPRQYQVNRAAYGSAQPVVQGPFSDAGYRIILADRLALYFSAGTPIYLRYEPRGSACVLEYDYGLDGHRSQPSDGGSLLIAPDWGSVGLFPAGRDRVEMDLRSVRLPGCSFPSQLTLEKSGDSWVIGR